MYPKYMYAYSRYNGRLYDNCVTLDNYGVPWCSFKLDADGNDIGFHYECNEDCHVNNCPLGFYRYILVRYRYSSNKNIFTK